MDSGPESDDAVAALARLLPSVLFPAKWQAVVAGE